MRISDWSSDVCSSDLHLNPVLILAARSRPPPSSSEGRLRQSSACGLRQYLSATCSPMVRGGAWKKSSPVWSKKSDDVVYTLLKMFRAKRSEEHTSELQSLMRISYAVFCLKKKTSRKHNTKQYTK